MATTTWSDRLRAARERAGLTQREVSAQSGITERTLSDWENNPDRNYRERDLERVCDVIGVTVAEVREEPAK